MRLATNVLIALVYLLISKIVNAKSSRLINSPVSNVLDRELENIRSFGKTCKQSTHSSIITDMNIVANNDNSNKETSDAIKNTIVTVGISVLFAILTFLVKGQQSAIEFITGYLVEKSLSIDNLFVFLMLFEYFKIPAQLQSRVLTWGLIGAVLLRGAMIYLGVSAISKFKWITLVFSGILLLSGFKLIQSKHENEDEDLSQNFILKISKFFINSTEKFDGEQFFIVDNAGKWLATPLFMCLVAIEVSDFVFAVDSIPAVLGVSKDPFVVYSSNIFAILGMRSLFVLISKFVSELKYLKPAVALVLEFVGLKMIAEYFHYNLSPFLSLLVITIILSGGVILSINEKNHK